MIKLDKLNWNDIEELSSEDISYLLFTEGKNAKVISKIRNISKVEVEKHIIHSKIKYKAYKYGTDEKSIIKSLMMCPKDERLNIISTLREKEVGLIENYMINNIFNVNQKECNFYIWFLGEIKSEKGLSRIITFLKCNDGTIKRMCCSAIGKIGAKEAEGALIATLTDSRNQVKEYAIKSLGLIKSEKALVYLEKIATSNEKEYVKKAALNSIKNIKEGGE